MTVFLLNTNYLYKHIFFPLIMISEHTKNARKSTRDKHEKGQARQQREQQRSNNKKG